MLMQRLQEFKNYQPSLTKFVNVREKQYPVTIQGTGKIASLCVGGATLMQRTLSPNFKNLVTFYACDLYWPNNYKLENPSLLTM
jgi:hypothetical protein